ncbi:MAG: methyltransferase [Verrucomicrobia bacterium]|nr:methyltransferase [Verrucomicrobiota bacterium]
MNLTDRLKRKALHWSLPLPFRCRHIEYSALASADDDPGRPSERLFDVALGAVAAARRLDLSWISKRMVSPPYYPDVWPGEHYKLLAALVQTLQPRRVVEIGTFQGLGALALKHALPPHGELITLDIIPWPEIKDSALRPSDFEDGRLRQVIGDLSVPTFFSSFANTLAGTDLLFVDAPKDGRFERTLLQHLATIQLPRQALVAFDDIRQWNMLAIWREIARPKLDLTSFGHWTGTGLIDWNG